MMSKCNHEDFRTTRINDHGVGEAPEQEAFDPTNPGNTGRRRQRNNILFE